MRWALSSVVRMEAMWHAWDQSVLALTGRLSRRAAMLHAPAADMAGEKDVAAVAMHSRPTLHPLIMPACA